MTLIHPIDDMPVARPVRDLIEFSYNENGVGDLIMFNDTANAATDLFGHLDLSASFSWLYGSMDEIDIHTIAAVMHDIHIDDNNNDGAAGVAALGDCEDIRDPLSSKSQINIENELAMLSPLNESGTDWSYEYKRIIADLEKARRELHFD